MGIVGRDVETSDLRALLERSRAVALTGPPGIGKSALAACILPNAWVDLEEVHTADGLLTQVAGAVGAPAANERAIERALHGVPLLVLDGAESVLVEIGVRIEVWSACAPILITSRRAPRFAVSQLELGPLDPSDGARLLRQRVNSAQRAAILDESELRALSQSLDGVPLALEIAAPWLRVHDPSALVDRQLDELQDPQRPPRQQLLEAVRSGWTALSPGAQRLLGAASLLPGAFEASLLAATTAEPVEHGLLELLDAGMLHPLADAPPRFRVLAPVRAVALPTVDPPWREACLQRLARVVLPGASDRSRPLLERLIDSEDGSVRLRAAVALSELEHRTGPLQATLARDRTIADAGPDRERILWGLEVAGTACHMGRYEHAREALDRIEPLLDEEHRPAWLSMEAVWLAAVGRADEGLAQAIRAVDLGHDPWLSFRLGGIRFARGEVTEAAAAFRRARAAVGGFRQGQATYALCASLRDQGAPPEQILAELDGFALVADLSELGWLQPRFESVRGTLLADLGQVERAVASLDRATEGLRRLGEPDDAVDLWLVCRSLDLLRGRIPTEVLEPIEPRPGERIQPGLDCWRAVVHALCGRTETAEGLGVQAVQELRRTRGRMLPEMAAVVAVALGPVRPEVARGLLVGLEADPTASFARRLLDGERPSPRPRIEERVLVAIAELGARRTRVATDGTAFVGADGTRVDLSRRRVLRQVLATLARADGPLGVDAICAAVWPGEALVGDSGTRRVHVAISSLRGMGLRSAIATVSPARGHTAWELIAQRLPEL